jgi:two-component sensor histidine kinase
VSELGQALEFRELVTREMHHRVKNTLQVAMGLLSLQCRANCSSEVRTALTVACDRLHVLAAVHEMLSLHAVDGRSIAMPPLLRALASALAISFSDVAARVRVRVSAEEVRLAADQAIALALFANEAITNAYLHAYPAGASGEIVVQLRHTGEAVILEVSDDGAGMPPGDGNDGLGLKLMRGFAGQLTAAISIPGVVGGGGTVVRLWVPLGASPEIGHGVRGDIRAMPG